MKYTPQMRTTTTEVVYVPDNVDGKAYMGYQRFKLRVWIFSGLSILIVISLAVALIIQILNFSTFLSQKYDLAEGDMRIISVSTAFCEEISLGKDASVRTLSILPSMKLGHQFRRTNTSNEVFVSKFLYWYKGFYLLRGSSIVINAESDDALSLFIFKDKTRLNEWIDRNGDPRKTISAAERPQGARPTTQPTRISYSLNALETGNYYILFEFSKGAKEFARMKLDLSVNRKLYDLTPSVYSCSAGAKDTCSARLLFGSSEVGVIEVIKEPIQSSYRGNELTITWQCVPRIWFYVAVFAGPTLFAAVVSFSCYFVVISRDKQKCARMLDQCSLERASVAGRCNSLSYRSLSGSMRRPPSETPSARNSDMSRSPCFQPVVTTMYTGDSLSASEDSGNDTDEEIKQNSATACAKKGKSSVDGISVASREITVCRKPSFTTFQGSDDEAVKIRTAKSRNPGGRLCESTNNQKSERTNFNRFEMRYNFQVGSLPKNLPARRYSSDEIFGRGSRTLPVQRGYLATGVRVPHQHAPGADGAAFCALTEGSPDSFRGRRSCSERLHKPKYDHRGLHDKILNGPIQANSRTRRYSSDEIFERDRISINLPRSHDNSKVSTRPAYQPISSMESPMSRNSSEGRRDFCESEQPTSKRPRNILNDKLCERERISRSLPRNHDNTESTRNPPYQPTTITEAALSRNSLDRNRNICESGQSGTKKPRKPSSEARNRPDGQGIGINIPNGTIPNSSIRRCSSDELGVSEVCGLASKSLPRNRGHTLPAAPLSDQLAPEQFFSSSRPSSLPSLHYSAGSKGMQLHSVPNACLKGSDAGDGSDCVDKEKEAEKEKDIEPQSIKLRAHSMRRREMGWTPRLSMVSESEV